MNTAARTTLSFAAGLTVLALNLTAPTPAEAQSVRAELLAGAERGHEYDARARVHQTENHYGRDQRRDHRQHGKPHHQDHGRRHGGRHQDHYYGESTYYKAQHRKARSYANEAVSQAREARRLGFYRDHPRWSLNFDRHYRWALDRPPRKLEDQNYRRAAKLRELRAYYYSRHDHRRYDPYRH